MQKYVIVILSTLLLITGTFGGVQTARLRQTRTILAEANRRYEQYADAIANVRSAVGAVSELLSEDELTIYNIREQIQYIREIYESMEKYLYSIGIDPYSLNTDSDTDK